MMKKFLAIFVSAIMGTCLMCGLTACGGGDSKAKYNYNITVWVGEGTKSLTEAQIKKYNETEGAEKDVYFNAEVFEVSESVAAGDAIGNADAADIFCFAQDQLARLVRYSALSSLSANTVNTITANNDDDSVTAATLGNTVWAFPLTSDNAYFMYYDKRVVKEESVGSLEAIIADCVAANKNFAMNLTDTGGGWYAASFFYAAGCESEWPTDSNGKFTADYTDTIDYEHGLTAARGMKKLLNSSCYLASDKASSFGAAIPSAVVISGIWDYNTAVRELGSNLGIAALPSFYVDDSETTYQLKTYMGHKFMGVKPQSNAYRAAFLQQLALYLTNEDSQLARFTKVGWGPSNKNAQTNEGVLASEALNVLKASSTMPQGQYPTNWWNSMVDLTINIKDTSASSLSVSFNTYQSSLPALLTSNN